MQEIPIKTLWEEKAWVADRILRRAQTEGRGIVLKYKNETMTIPHDRIHPKFWQRGQEEYRDRYGRDPYVLFGIHFAPDESLQGALFQ